MIALELDSLVDGRTGLFELLETVLIWAGLVWNIRASVRAQVPASTASTPAPKLKGSGRMLLPKAPSSVRKLDIA
jgi:hypothetical protein